MEYLFKAKDYNNKKYQGYIKSNSKKEVYDYLVKQNLFPYYIVRNYKIFKSKKITLKTLNEFIRQWLSLEKAKIKTQEAIEIICENTIDKTLKNILSQISFDLTKGVNIKESLVKYEKYFPEFFITHIVTGLEKGNLEKTLELLFEYYQNQYNIKKKIKNATVYPKLLIMIFIISFTILCQFIIPSFASLYDELEVEKNVIVSILLKCINFLNDNLIWLVISCLFFVILLYHLTKIKKVRYLIDRIKTMLFKKYYNIYYTYLFGESICLLWNTGYNKFESIDILQFCIPNMSYKEKILKLKDDIQKGMSISDGLNKRQLFDIAYRKMFVISEINNFMDDNLTRARDYFKFEYQQVLDRRAKLIEPILIGLISILVLGLILIVFLPILSSVKVVM